MHVHHLAFRSHNVTGLAAFYRRWLGVVVVRDELPRALWLALTPGSVLMIEKREAGEPAPVPGSLELVAFAVSAERRGQLRADLVSAGLLEAETAHTLYFRDPDGRRIGLSSYPL